MRELVTDYLVIGAGASGMAFVDSLLDASDAEIVLVDRRHRPGGHWLDAYPFVRLHQPSANYGVPSRQLGNDRVDESHTSKDIQVTEGKDNRRRDHRREQRGRQHVAASEPCTVEGDRRRCTDNNGERNGDAGHCKAVYRGGNPRKSTS